MISGTCGNSLGIASSLSYLQQLQGAGGVSASSNTAAAQGTTGPNQISTTISGPGQLFSNLQQLQAQDPAKFQQVVSDIASQLQAASKQAQGPQSDFLSNLAAKFQNVANGGSLSQLLPGQHQHLHHAHKAYGEGAQTQTQGIAGLAAPSGDKSASSSSLQQLLRTISSEVKQALAS
jgi:hypothetical protein